MKLSKTTLSRLAEAESDIRRLFEVVTAEAMGRSGQKTVNFCPPLQSFDLRKSLWHSLLSLESVPGGRVRMTYKPNDGSPERTERMCDAPLEFCLTVVRTIEPE